MTNIEAKNIDVEESRKKLASQNRYLHLEGDIVSLSYRTYHIKSAKAMNLNEYDKASALEGSMLVMVLQTLLLLCTVEVDGQ